MSSYVYDGHSRHACEEYSRCPQHRVPSSHPDNEDSMSNVRSIGPDEGLTEREIIRVAHRLSYSLPGEGLSDIRAMYQAEGKDPGKATLSYVAAKTYLTMSEKQYHSTRPERPTRRDMPAQRNPIESR